MDSYYQGYKHLIRVQELRAEARLAEEQSSASSLPSAETEQRSHGDGEASSPASDPSRPSEESSVAKPKPFSLDDLPSGGDCY